MQKNNKTATFFFFLCMSLIVQAQDFPKTIYELYDLPKGGEYPNVQGLEYLLFKAREYDEDEQKNATSKDDPILKRVNSALKIFKKASKLNPEVPITTKKLRNGNFCFLKKRKWGLKSANGEIILPPKFDFVKLDTLAGGFVGYQKVLSNYYDGKTGKKVLKKDYYSVQAVDKSAFIIQSKDGYGLIHLGKIIIPPSNRSILKRRIGNDFYYRIASKGLKFHVLLTDYTTKIRVAHDRSPRLITKDYILFEHDLYHLKTQKCLICNSGYSLRLIDEKKQLLSIKSERTSTSYLIDFDGNIIAKQKFADIKPFSNGISIVTSTENNEQNSFFNKKGFINSQGKWILSPQYKSIIQQGEYYVAINFNKKTGLIDAKGNIILPFKYDFIKRVRGNEFLCRINQKAAIDSKILIIPSLKIKRDSLHYKFIEPSKSCSSNYFTAYFEKGQQIIDENYNPVTAIYDYIFFEKKYLKGKTFRSAASKVNKFNLHTCDGEKIYFDIDGKKLDTFDVIKILSDQLIYVYLDNEKGYLIPTKGQAIPFDHYINVYQKIYGRPFLALGKTNSNTRGLIDSKGKTVLPFVFNNLQNISEDDQLIKFISQEGKAGIFSSKGDLFTKRLYDNISYSGLGLYKVMERVGKGEKWGLINRKGKYILPMEYTKIYLRGGLVFAKKGENIHIFNRRGKPIK